ncbi:MAG: hypothetical protein ABDH49_05335 [Candidatus Hydrothermales bacterium]
MNFKQRELLVNFLIFIPVFLTISLFSLFSDITDDEGIPLNAVLFMLKGGKIYEELFEFWGPFSFYINYPILKFFPQNLLTVRIFTSFLISIEILLLFQISKEFLSSRNSKIMIFFFVLNLITLKLIIPSLRWYTSFLNVFSIFFLINYIKNGKSLNLFLSGVFTGLNIFNMQNYGLFLAISTSIFLYFFLKSYKDTILYLLGVLLVTLFWSTLLFFQGVLDDYIKNFHLIVLTGSYTQSQWSYNNDWFNYLNIIKSTFLSIFILDIKKFWKIFITFFNFFMPIFTFILTPLFLEREKKIIVLLLTSVFQYLSMLIQGPDVLRCFSFLPFSYVLFFKLVKKIPAVENLIIKNSLRVFVNFLFLYLILRALTHIHYVFTTKKSFLNLERAKVFVEEGEKKGYLELKKFLDEEVKDKKVFFLDNGAIFYFLFKVEIPVYRDFIEPNFPIEIQERIIKDIKEKRIEYIIQKINLVYPKDWSKDKIFDYVIKNYNKIRVIKLKVGEIIEIYKLKNEA